MPMRHSLWPCTFLLLGAVAMAKDDADFMHEADFIEFMGSWETPEGKWLPPDEIEKMKMPKEDEKKAKENDEADTDE